MAAAAARRSAPGDAGRVDLGAVLAQVDEQHPAGLLRIGQEWTQARGEALDLRDFHAAVLAHGAMPLPDLRREVRRLLG